MELWQFIQAEDLPPATQMFLHNAEPVYQESILGFYCHSIYARHLVYQVNKQCSPNKILQLKSFKKQHESQWY